MVVSFTGEEQKASLTQGLGNWDDEWSHQRPAPFAFAALPQLTC